MHFENELENIFICKDIMIQCLGAFPIFFFHQNRFSHIAFVWNDENYCGGFKNGNGQSEWKDHTQVWIFDYSFCPFVSQD